MSLKRHKYFIVEMLDISLFKSLSFNIIIFSILILTIAYFIPFAYCTPRAVALGVDASKAAFLLSILGKRIQTGINSSSSTYLHLAKAKCLCSGLMPLVLIGIFS